MQLRRYLSFTFFLVFFTFATQALAASSRRVGTSENVSTYGVSKDYSVLNTWEGWSDRDLATENVTEVLEIADDQTSYDDYISAAGATVNASYFRSIRPASGAGHDGTPNNGVTFHRTSDGGVFYINEAYFQLQDIIATFAINSATNRRTFALDSLANEAAIVGCISWNSTNDGAGQAIGFMDWVGAGNNSYFINNLSINSDETGFQKMGAGTTYFYNNTAVENGTHGFNRSGGGTAICVNCVSTDNVSGDRTGTWTWTTSTAEGDTIVYVNADGDDFHLTSGDTTARRQGTNLRDATTNPFDDDVDSEKIIGLWSKGFDSVFTVPGGSMAPFLY